MKKRSIALLLAVAMLFTMVLSACGGDSNSSSQGSSSEAGASSAAGNESSSEAGESSAESSEASTGNKAAAGITTEVGTPREDTLIVECQSSTDCAGQFNTYMTGTGTGFGIHQLMSAHLWEIDRKSVV